MFGSLKQWLSKAPNAPSELNILAAPPNLFSQQAQQVQQWFLQFCTEIDDVTLAWGKKNAPKIPTIALEQLPRPPGNLPKMMASFKSGDASAQQLAEGLRLDPTLSSSLMRVINSPMYYTYRNCSSIEDALVRLGADGFGALISTAIAQPLAQRDAGALTLLKQASWELNGIATHIAEQRATQLGLPGIRGFMAAMADEIALLASCQATSRIKTKLSSSQLIALTYHHYQLHRLRIASQIAELWQLDKDSSQFCIKAIAGEGSEGQVLAQSQLGALIITQRNQESDLEEVDFTTRWRDLGLNVRLYQSLTEQ